MQKHYKKLYPNLFTYPALAIFSIFFFLPVVAGFAFSFTNWDIERIFHPTFNGLANFIHLFTDQAFGLAVKNTLVFAAATTVLKLVFGLFLALVLNLPLRTRNFMRTVFYMPSVLSMVGVGIIFTSLFRMNGMVNIFLKTIGLSAFQHDWLANPTLALLVTILAEAWKWSGFTMALLLAGLQGIPKDYYEASRIDGASSLQQFRHITLPMLMPSLNIALTFNIIGGLKVFEQIYVITQGGPGDSTQVFSTYIFNTFSAGELGRSTAMGTLLFIFVFAVSSLSSRFFRSKEVEA